MKYSICSLAIASLLLVSVAQAEEKGSEIKLADGHLQLLVAPEFKKEKPANRIIEFEFSTPAAEGDEIEGRLTAMGAGGSLEANIGRWMAQFQQPDGSETKDKTKITEEKIAGQTVHLVDITGTYADGRPFGPKTQRPGYRMLAAIIMTEKYGNYFIKFYGPQATIKKNEKAFKSSIESLKVQ